ncbi:MAG: Holliday junction branch migration protein RuvA [Actinomycetia bacterium]|nr:Holliday junction branch migration protein RuvA [Actinomycetes bacterium]MCP4227726.1 Holliday junction branch migration protein RuvA [Actinomycetes bacterium]
MIGSLRGRVLDREAVTERSAAAEVLVEVAGVGYRVAVTAATLDRLGASTEAMLYIHHHIREADQKLYGFLTKDERIAFEGLLAAHGVGPSLALAVLATHPAARLARILAEDDLAALCEVPGVGKKTAQRLLVELRSTLVLPVLDGEGPSIELNGSNPALNSTLLDVREALANLGYSAEEIKIAMAEVGPHVVTDPDLDAGQLLKRALRAMAGV